MTPTEVKRGLVVFGYGSIFKRHKEYGTKDHICGVT
jgi:hypothetical protein